SQQQRYDAKWNCEWKCQQNRNRVNERFKLSSQYHVHEDEREYERQHEVISCASKLFRSSRQTGSVLRIKIHLFHKVVHLLKNRSLRSTRFHVGQQRDLSLSIQTIDG